MAEDAIRARGLGKRYRLGQRQPYKSLRETLVRVATSPLRVLRHEPAATIWALRDVSFEVEQGEVIGVIGRNGAGKSTLLRILARITEPTQGRAEIRGRIASLLEVGTGFHPELTGRENTFLSGAVLGMRKAEIVACFDEIVAFAEIEQFIDTPVKWYSSGMYLRLAFAVAAHLQPEILLVDEVLAVGDAAFQRKCLGRMGEVAQGGRTVLFVSHNMAAVRTLCTRGLVLEAGQLTMEGEANSCVDHYLSTLETNPHTGHDVASMPRPHDHYGRVFRFTKVRVRPAEGGFLCTKTPFVVDVEFDCGVPLNEVILGFSVYSAEGARLMMCMSTHEGRPFPHLDPGHYTVTAQVDRNPLLPGRYMLDIGARGNGKGVDVVPERLYFEVVESSLSGVDFHMQDRGYFFVPSRWDEPKRCSGDVAFGEGVDRPCRGTTSGEEPVS